jgi:cytoskeletal protein CcmA (bactofilin family)
MIIPKETSPMQMFSSSRKVEPAMPMTATPPAPPAATKPEPAPNGAPELARPGGTLSSGVSIKGTVKFQKELLIDCEVEGKIDSNGRLTVGKQARIKGDIKTRSVIVDGTVDGNITAGERCELRAGCTVNGDIEAPRLVVDEAASFIGSAKIATQKVAPTPTA